MKQQIKSYFEDEVKKTNIPAFPLKSKKQSINPWETILLTALTVASMVLIYLPSSYITPIRTITISKEAREDIKVDFTRVVQGINSYANEKRRMHD